MDTTVSQEFVLEANAALHAVEHGLLNLEKADDPAALNRIFRSLHTIKGSSGFLELKAIEELAHQAETLLDKLRKGQRAMTPETVDALLGCVDALRQMVASPDLGATFDAGAAHAALTALDAPPAVPPDVRTPPPKAIPRPPTESSAAPPPRQVPIDTGFAAALAAPGADVPADEKLMKVRVQFLDELLQLTGNMVMARNQMLSRYDFTRDPAFAALSQCVTAVHKSIVQTRMHPIGTLFDRCERMVRDVGRQVHKEVGLEVDGRELELDRSVLEAFADPLTHLIRNAIDHGLESPADRQLAGKPRAGTVRLTARQQAGEVLLTVEDDGRGVDPQRVRDKAVQKGLVTPEKAAELTRRETLALLFRPGFSTRDEVTTLSGRGVGLDVVECNVKALGGAVELHSTPGQGTRFVVRLPLTQALVSSSLISALVVAHGPERYAIPQTAVDEIIKVRPGDVRPLNGRRVYQLRDHVLPVVSLAEVLRPGDPPAADGCVLVVMEFRQQLFGLLADAVLGVEEIVVRPLPELVKTCKVFAGHTVMGDGGVALILDGNGVVEQQKLVFADEHVGPLADAGPRTATQRLVTFSYADDERFAVPLEMVSIIERIAAADIHAVGPNEFVRVKNRMLPLLRLDKVLPVRPLPPLAEMYLLVPARVSHPIAVLAGRAVSVIDADGRYEPRLTDDPGTLGGFLHDNKLVLLLDLYRLFERHSPERFKPPAVEQKPAEVLVAEDSPFFQNLVRSYLNDPPRKLTIVDDGQAALDLLRQQPARFDAVISDIEMPRMNGFDLIGHIRADPHLRHLPVIAMTSLAAPEHVERGLREGFDSYLVKIDKEQLVTTLNKHLARARSG